MTDATTALDVISGPKLYHQRAREALPMLVRQAQAGQPIFYSDLAEELGMTNPRVLNYPLGCVGEALQKLSEEWEESVPPIQCLVVSKSDGLPGEGVGWFLDRGSLSGIGRLGFERMSKQEKREVVKVELQRVFSYRRWREVLDALDLPYRWNKPAAAVDAAARLPGGEGPEHLALKRFVAENPDVVDLPNGTSPGDIEYLLPSGDSLDVSFQGRTAWVAAEVKPASSGAADIARGLFQCVKYAAVMEALQVFRGIRKSARAVLVLGGVLPSDLISLRNALGVEVFENVGPLRPASR